MGGIEPQEHRHEAGRGTRLRHGRWHGLFLGIGLLATLALALTYSLRSRELQAEASKEMARQADRVVSEIEPYLVIASQLSRTTAALISPLRGDPEGVRSVLAKVLASAPPETIFGVGAWFEPHIFAPAERYFGPYVHQPPRAGDPPVFTDEWARPDYDFHHQGWYLAGRSGGGNTVFTDPYFDTNQVYMSASTAFFEPSGSFAGVATVDMVLPMLREFALRFNTHTSRIVYLSTRKGAIFVHPEEEALLAHARRLDPGRTTRSILDLKQSDLSAYERMKGRGDWRIVTRQVAHVGWEIHVATAPRAIATSSRKLQSDFLAFGVGIWIIVALGLAMTRAFGGKLASARWEQRRLEEEINERQAAEALLTEHKRALEEAVQRRTEELAHLNAGKDHLISILAHDMRGLFGAIMGYSQLLAMSEEHPGKGRSLVHTLDSAVRQAHRLFENLLLWIRLHSDRVEFAMGEVSLAGAVSASLAMVSDYAMTRRVEIQMEVDEGLIALGDSNMIETLIRNLVSNALKFTPSGGKITVRGRALADSLEIAIEDTGIGMEAEQATRLFNLERFSSTPGLDGAKGTGLGLHICHEIVSKLDGTMDVTSRPGQGTIVRFTLPRV